MLTVIASLSAQHDPWLIVFAGMLCALGSVATLLMVHHTREANDTERHAWLAGTSVIAGFTIWSTHFIALFAFSPRMPMGYDAGLTLLALVVVVGILGLALSIALEPAIPHAGWVGGSVVGAGIAATHLTGMVALHAPGVMIWNEVFEAAAVAWGIAFASAALAFGVNARRWKETAQSAALLMAAIGGYHYLSMAGCEIVFDPAASIPQTDLDSSYIGRIGAAGIALFLLAFAALDIARQRARLIAETCHMRDLADASLDGLVIWHDDAIAEANLSFERMTGLDRTALKGRKLTDIVPALPSADLMRRGTCPALETTLRSADGGEVHVEMIPRPISFAGKPSLALAFRDLTSRRRAEAEVRFLAYHDPLTGLPNRMSFKTKLEQKLLLRGNGDAGLAVMALDLDGFKAVNDTLGHAMGDLLLKEIGKRLQMAIREPNLVARLGGDEFAVLVPDVTREAAAVVARDVIDTIGQPYMVSGHVLNVGSSVGIAMAPIDGTEASELLKKADLGMYRSKTEGRGTHHFYEHEMDAQMRHRHALEIDLHNAVAYHQFELYYQPLLSVKSGKINGCEALVRWRHPARGLVSPADFIPLAEETGLIIPMGEWVIQTACQQAAKWCGGQSVAVNLSPVQFRSPRLIDMVGAALETSGLEPKRLWLEITETVFLADNAAVVATLHRLRGLGVRISLDDFGTGYSSLNYLRAFPFDKMKIDRSFISQLGESHESGAIVHAVVGLGHSLSIVTTAEGVETQEQFSHMEAEGCDEIQGYFVSRPVPSADIEALLATRNTSPSAAVAA